MSTRTQKPNLIQKMLQWFEYNKLSLFIYKTHYRIKRLIRYVPVIWNSGDFDYRYATELFRMKLEDLATFMESDKAWSATAKQDARRIRTAIQLLENVYSEKYATEYFDIMEQTYGENCMDFHFNDETKKLPNGIVTRKGLCYEYENWDNADEIRIHLNELQEQCWERQEKANKLLWRFIEHNIERWWD